MIGKRVTTYDDLTGTITHNREKQGRWGYTVDGSSKVRWADLANIVKQDDGTYFIRKGLMEGELRRLGRFTIVGHLINIQPEVVLLILQRCLVLRAEHHLVSDHLEYTALSKDFDLIQTGYLPPLYHWMIEGSNNRVKRIWAECREQAQPITRDNLVKTLQEIAVEQRGGSNANRK